MQKLSRNFSREEFACQCGCGYDTVDVILIMLLESVRRHFDKPVTITSGCRCEHHNNNVGGSSRSQHLLGRAADIVVKDVEPLKVYQFLDITWPDRYGFGNYETFTHVDSRNSRARWRG